MAIQDQINDYAARVDGYATKVAEGNSRVEAAVAVVRQEISDLKAVPVGEPADFSSLDTALSHVDTAVSDLGNVAADVEGLEPPAVSEPTSEPAPPAGTEEPSA